LHDISILQSTAVLYLTVLYNVWLWNIGITALRFSNVTVMSFGCLHVLRRL